MSKFHHSPMELAPVSLNGIVIAVQFLECTVVWCVGVVSCGVVWFVGVVWFCLTLCLECVNLGVNMSPQSASVSLNEIVIAVQFLEQ